jgi:hypothetical protein
VADNFYPFDPGFKPLPRAGLTRLNLVTAGAGQAAVIRVTPADPTHMLDRPDGVPFASVTNSSDSLDQVRTRLETASRAKSGGSGPGAQLWADVLAGKTPVVASPNNSAAVLHLLKAVEPYKNVKLVLVLSGEAVAETTPALKGKPVSVVLRPGLDLLPNTRDRFNPARTLHEAGVEFAFSFSARPQTAAAAAAAAAQTPDAEPPAPVIIDPEFLLFPVAVLVKTGLPRSAALEALAKRPAAMTGLGATHGTIEPGKAADLLIYTGDPLDPGSRLTRTLIDGRTVYAN